MNLKVKANKLREAGIIVLGYHNNDNININSLCNDDRLKYFRLVEREENANDD